jgi:hypothetical protein
MSTPSLLREPCHQRRPTYDRDLIHLRHNPFFAYIETRVITFLGLAEDWL